MHYQLFMSYRVFFQKQKMKVDNDYSNKPIYYRLVTLDGNAQSIFPNNIISLKEI